MGKITYFSDFQNQNQNHPKTVIFKIKIRSPERSDFDQNHSNHLKIRSDFQNHFKITSKSLSKYIIPKTEYVLWIPDILTNIFCALVNETTMWLCEYILLHHIFHNTLRFSWSSTPRKNNNMTN